MHCTGRASAGPVIVSISLKLGLPSVPLRGGLQGVQISADTRFHMFKNILYHTVLILKKLSIRIPHNFLTRLSYVCVSFFVLLPSAVCVVLAPVKLNNQLCFCTIEVHNVPPERHLTAKSYTQLIPSQQ
jgi:hypothetical protein